jgi:hypothetical protein
MRHKEETDMELWIATCSFIGAVVGGVVSAYVSGRYGEKGKIDAAVGSIDKLAHQVKVLTHTTESIKTELSAGEWDRQWAKNQKVTAYSDLILGMEKILSHQTQMLGWQRQMPSSQAAHATYSRVQYAAAGLKGVELDNEWRAASVRATLFAESALMQTVFQWSQIYASRVNRVDGEPDFEAIVPELQKAQEHVLLAVRRELGASELL